MVLWFILTLKYEILHCCTEVGTYYKFLLRRASTNYVGINKQKFFSLNLEFSINSQNYSTISTTAKIQKCKMLFLPTIYDKR